MTRGLIYELVKRKSETKVQINDRLSPGVVSSGDRGGDGEGNNASADVSGSLKCEKFPLCADEERAAADESQGRFLIW